MVCVTRTTSRHYTHYEAGKTRRQSMASMARAVVCAAILSVLHVAGACQSELDCTLSGACVKSSCVCDKPWTGPTCASLKLKPARYAKPFSPHSDQAGLRYTWGAAPFYDTANGRVCFYFTWLLSYPDGNDTRPVPWNDTVSGSLGLACSNSVHGPFAVVKTVAFPFRRSNFDAAYIENCVLTYSKENGGYLLAYTTAPSNETRNTKNWEGNGGQPTPSSVNGLEYIGVAFSKSPLGPWERLNATLLPPDWGGFEQGVANNPAVLWFPNGTLTVAYRGARDDGFGNCVAKSWRDACVRPKKNLFPDPRWVGTEDAFTYKSKRGYIMIAHTFKKHNCTGGGLRCGAGVKAVSEDGLHWTYVSDAAYTYDMTLQNGTVLHFNRREEPKLLIDEETQRPVALFNVVDDSFLYNSSHIIVQELDYS